MSTQYTLMSLITTIATSANIHSYFRFSLPKGIKGELCAGWMPFSSVKQRCYCSNVDFICILTCDCEQLLCKNLMYIFLFVGETDTCLTASFPGQLGKPTPERF